MTHTFFSETSLAQSHQEYIQPFWQEQVQHGELVGENDVPIRYAFALHPNPTDSLLISSGRIETLLKYKELMYDCYARGYSVFILDHRGQGLSGRMTDNPQKGYVESFEHFVADMRQFYQSVMQPYVNGQTKLLCHSMGGCIGTLYCMAYPDDFAKIALSAPMYGIRPALPGWFANVLIASHIRLSGATAQNPKFFFGQGDYESTPFKVNLLTHSQPRYDIFQTEYRLRPEVQLGGVTSHWLKAAKAAMDTVFERAPTLSLPVLLLQASEDKVVDNASQDRVAARLPNCEKIAVQGAKHEILMEKDDLRRPALEKVFSFFSE